MLCTATIFGENVAHEKATRRYGTFVMGSSSNAAYNFARISATVCVFVMIREFRPVEPFLTLYLTSPPISLSEKEVNEKIYPVGTYASFFFVIILFLVTDYLRYKPIIILDGITGIFTYALLLGKPSLTLYIIEQIFYGFFYSSDVACNTYLYAKIEDPSHYQKITGYVRASSLLGRFISGVFSQIAVSSGAMDENILMYASIGGMVFVTLWAFAVPSVDRSIYFHRAEIPSELPMKTTFVPPDKVISNNESEKDENGNKMIHSEKLYVVGRHLWHDFKAAYFNMYVLKWSAWWSFSACGYYFVATYSQVLWNVVAKENAVADPMQMWNGAVESISTILSAASAFMISKIEFSWRNQGDWVLAFFTIILSAVLFLSYACDSLWLIYVAYIAYNTVYQTILTVAQSEVAQNLSKDSYALIFGFNNFVALGLGSLFTYVAITGDVLDFNTKGQFMFYSVFYLAIAVIVGCKALISSLLSG